MEAGGRGAEVKVGLLVAVRAKPWSREAGEGHEHQRVRAEDREPVLAQAQPGVVPGRTAAFRLGGSLALQRPGGMVRVHRGGLFQPDLGIHPGLHDVRQEVERHDQRGVENDRAEHQRVVAVKGARHEFAAETGDLEDRLNDK